MLDIENSALIDLLKTDYAPGNPGLREQLDEVAEEPACFCAAASR